MQTFEEGFATLSAVVRDAQGSRVSDFNRPVDLRLCEASPVPGGEPRCPSPTAALTAAPTAIPTSPPTSSSLSPIPFSRYERSAAPGIGGGGNDGGGDDNDG